MEWNNLVWLSVNFMEKLSLQVTCLKGWRTSATRNVCLKIQGRRIPTYTKTTLCISSKCQVKKIRCQFSVQHVGPTDYSMIISVHTIGGCKWVVSNSHMTLFGALGVSQTTSLSADSASDPLEFTCCDLHGIRLGAKRVTGFALNLCRKIPPCPTVMICAKKKNEFPVPLWRRNIWLYWLSTSGLSYEIPFSSSMPYCTLSTI